MDQIKERCIYCGSDVYYTGTEVLIKCDMCGHTLVVAKFENELARMNQAIEEGEQVKKELAEAEKARQEAQVRLQNTLENLDEIKGGQDVLSLLIQSVIAEQDTAEGKLAQVHDMTDRILKRQGDLFEGMSILGEIKDKLQEIGLNEKAQKDFAEHFVDWFRNIHADDVARMEQLQDRTSSILAEQKEISDKIDSLHQVAEETKAKIDAFENRYAQDKLGELRQLYRQAQNYQFDRAYDKAYDKYEQIVIKGGGDAAVLWHMILCHYCVSYQENDEGEMIPIIMNPDITDPDEMSLRLDFENMLNDSSLVTEEQVEVYRHELDKIDSILDEYRHVRHQENYDIFISVKQDEDGHYTYDSDFAADLYYYLISKGYKVFNSRISKIPAGEEYEPYIISALLSARVMIVVGTSPENMNAAWVKNEWSRFQWIQQSEKRSKGETDRLLLCYLAKGMQPRDLPKALNPNCQAIVEGVDSGDILTETLDDIFRSGRLRQKAFFSGKKQSKPAVDRNKTEKDTKKTIETLVSKKEAPKPLKEDAGLKSVPAGSGTDDGEKGGEDTGRVSNEFTGKWVIGVAAAVLIAVLILNRLGSGVHKAETAVTAETIETVVAEAETEAAAEAEAAEEAADAAVAEVAAAEAEAAEEADAAVAEAEAEAEAAEAAEQDYVIDWKDENLEKAMRKITGITEREIMYSDVKDITELDLSRSGISDISSLGNLTNLTRLSLHTNQISDISSLGNLTNLTKLSLNENQISDISSLRDLTNLTFLDLGENQISDISSLGNLTNLKTLYLNSNIISDISSLGDLTNLQLLALGWNKTIDISSLGSLTNLTSLSLTNNYIRDIGSLSNLTNLTTLNLRSNQISDISVLKNLKKLEKLDLRDNPITDYSPIEGLNIKDLFK